MKRLLLCTMLWVLVVLVVTPILAAGKSWDDGGTDAQDRQSKKLPEHHLHAVGLGRVELSDKLADPIESNERRPFLVEIMDFVGEQKLEQLAVFLRRRGIKAFRLRV